MNLRNPRRVLHNLSGRFDAIAFSLLVGLLVFGILTMGVGCSGDEPEQKQEEERLFVPGPGETASVVYINGQGVGVGKLELSLQRQGGVLRGTLSSVEDESQAGTGAVTGAGTGVVPEAAAAVVLEMTFDADELGTSGKTSAVIYGGTGQGDADPAFGVFLDGGAIQLSPKDVYVELERLEAGVRLRLKGVLLRVGVKNSPDVSIEADLKPGVR